MFENSKDNNSGNFIEQDLESDWNRESGTGDDIPDPSMQKEPLYQNSGKLPSNFMRVIQRRAISYDDIFERVGHTNDGNDYCGTYI